MKYKAVIPVLAAVGILLAGCNQPVEPVPDKVDGIYEIFVKPIINGSVTVYPESGYEGTEITVLLNPEPGYRLQKDSLNFHVHGITTLSGSNRGNILESNLKFDMPEGGAWIDALFVPVAPGLYTVTSEPAGNGYVTGYPLYGEEGTMVSITVKPDPGYSVKEGFPKANGVSINGPPYSTNFSNKNLILTVEFAKTGANGLVENARRYLSAGDYDNAFMFYESAYLQDQSNDEAAIYAALGKLLNILNDSRVRRALQPFGMETVPGNLNKWLYTDIVVSPAGMAPWLQEYDDKILPIMSFPQGFPQGFNNYSVYQVNNTNGMKNGMRTGGPSMGLFSTVLFWGLVGRNPNGFDRFFQDLHESIFADNFEEAVSRIEALRYDQKVLLHNQLRIALKIDEIYAEGDYIGRADLELLLSCFYAVKGALEWIRSYKWEMDLTVMRCSVGFSNRLNEILATLSTSTLKNRIELIDRNYSGLARILPFRNNFFKPIDNGIISRSKIDFSLAAGTFMDGVSNLSSVSAKAKFDEAAEYKWIKDGIFALKSALDNGGNFYFPSDLPDKGESWVTVDTADYGVNVEKFFTPGSLSIDKLVYTEQGGKMPAFYGFTAASATGVRITPDTDLKQFLTFNFTLNKEELGKVFVKGLENKMYARDQFSEIWIHNENGFWLYNYYQFR